jgi:hypothetical protein
LDAIKASKCSTMRRPVLRRSSTHYDSKKNRTGSHREVILQLKMVEKTEYLQCSFLNFHPHVSKELLPQKI